MKKFTALMALVFLCLSLKAQNFYVTTVRDTFPQNKTFELSISNCDSLQLYSCPPTNNPSQYFENEFTDIALDKNNTLYYVSAYGSLYARSLADTSTCQYLGSFGNSINALVADTAGALYAAGHQNGTCTLYKYSGGTFSTLGNLPPSFFSTGDLFFYEHRLFLTANDNSQSIYFIAEVNMASPSQSCYYMDLLNLEPMAAFSVRNGAASRAFIISSNNYPACTLYELNMNNQTFGSGICTYPFGIWGAATYYNLTASTTSCSSLPTFIKGLDEAGLFLKIQNPVSDLISIQTNIASADISSFSLLDLSGRVLKEFRAQDFPRGISISGQANGTYFLRVVTNKGQALTQKLVKVSD